MYVSWLLFFELLRSIRLADIEVLRRSGVLLFCWVGSVPMVLTFPG